MERPIEIHTFLALVACITALWLGKFLIKLYRHRRRMACLPGPPYHWLVGHLFVAYKMGRALPFDVFPHHYWHYLKTEYNLGDLFYFDVWPMGPTILVICDAEIAEQVTVKQSLPKHWMVKQYLSQHLGPENLAAANGAKWKKARTIHNPGFAIAHLITVISSIIEDVMTFHNILEEHCDLGDVFAMEETAMKLSFDVIGKLSLNMSLNSQRKKHVLVEAFRRQLHFISRKSTWAAPFVGMNPIRIYQIWQNSKLIDRYLGEELDRRFRNENGQPPVKNDRRCIMDMSIDKYHSELREQGKEPNGMDAEFRQGAVDQLRTFIFAGHDTISTAIAMIYYFLSSHPECHRKACTELDDVFGVSLESTANQIRANPYLLNQLPYNMAVMKEALRLFPPAQTIRAGAPDVFVTDKQGEHYPTYNSDWVVWPDSYIIGRNPKHFPDPDRFFPERWLDGSPFPAIAPGAFRAFERGPRNCIGGEFGILEIKVVMALTLRSFDFEPAYELDALHVDGEKCYQMLFGSAKPKDGVPMKVRRRIASSS